ncbi:hypothetical protein O6H91_02G095600 [Diphasiastrum complanatum]|uniref:Uncharacterized protein n=1 Tax=Diphasiastrum complanatum TaxID=34168 RepID=A0ACC2EIQ6_DIPCM|nr:hypothetical protein O6H91_02G095600 [Diphasiastrum complanatum]
MLVERGSMMESLDLDGGAQRGFFSAQGSSSSLFFTDNGLLPSEDEWPFIRQDWSGRDEHNRKESSALGISAFDAKTSLFSPSWPNPIEASGAQESLSKLPVITLDPLGQSGSSMEDMDANVSSRSLSSLFSNKLTLSTTDTCNGQSVDTSNSYSNSEDAYLSLEDPELHTIRTLLSDSEEELLVRTIDDFDPNFLPYNSEESEDFDLFSSGGGLELEGDVQNHMRPYNRGLQFPFTSGKRSTQPASRNGTISMAGEHPYGEHPSRTLFVRNISSNVEDSELRALFEQYGDIRTLYTSCKYRGFVMISYYDIRAARSAMHALQNKPLRQRKLDIHFSIPKSKPSDKDVIQGTLVAFNLDPSVSNDDLLQIFGVYGEVKEIRATPDKHYCRFIEYHDIRAAEAALRALNRRHIGGKRIKLEPCHPAGVRHSLMQQLNQDLEQEERLSSRHQHFLPRSPWIDSAQGYYSQWRPISNSVDSGPFLVSHESLQYGPLTTNAPESSYGVVSSHPNISSSSKTRIIGDHVSRKEPVRHSEEPFDCGNNLSSACSQSISDSPSIVHQKSNVRDFNNPDVISVADRSPSWRNNMAFHDMTLFERTGGASMSSQDSCWGNSHCNHIFLQNYQINFQQSTPSPSSMVWPIVHPSSFAGSNGHVSSFYGNNFGSALEELSFVEFPHAYPGNTTGLSSLSRSGSLVGGGMSHLLHSGVTGLMNYVNPANHDEVVNLLSSSSSGIFPLQQRGGILSKFGIPGSLDRYSVNTRFHKGDNFSAQADSKKQFQLDLDRIINGDDTRTTLMIKNIPNKYTSKMLLAAIDENHCGTYDFVYLPIDFKVFNGKKWEKFNSEKVASIAYARIQGRAALVAHFQNSSLMNEDKCCRPILFRSEGANLGIQDPFPVGFNVRTHLGKDHKIDINCNQGSSTASSSKNVSLSTNEICDSGAPVQ